MQYRDRDTWGQRRTERQAYRKPEDIPASDPTALIDATRTRRMAKAWHDGIESERLERCELLAPDSKFVYDSHRPMTTMGHAKTRQPRQVYREDWKRSVKIDPRLGKPRHLPRPTPEIHNPLAYLTESSIMYEMSGPPTAMSRMPNEWAERNNPMSYKRRQMLEDEEESDTFIPAPDAEEQATLYLRTVPLPSEDSGAYSAARRAINNIPRPKRIDRMTEIAKEMPFVPSDDMILHVGPSFFGDGDAPIPVGIERHRPEFDPMKPQYRHRRPRREYAPPTPILASSGPVAETYKPDMRSNRLTRIRRSVR